MRYLITLLLTAATCFGQYLSPVDFDGSTSSIEVPVDLTSTPVITVAFWVKMNAYTANDDMLMELGYNAGFAPGFYVVPDSSATGAGDWYWGVRTDGGTSVNSMARPSAGVWHHVAAVFDIRRPAIEEVGPVYVDGESVSLTFRSVQSDNTANFPNDTLYIGARNSSSLYLDGDLADVRIYDRELSAAEILQLSRMHNDSTAGPLLHTVYDLVGNNDSTSANGVTYGNDGVTDFYTCDGLNAQIVFPDSNDFYMPADFTWSAWVRSTEAISSIHGDTIMGQLNGWLLSLGSGTIRSYTWSFGNMTATNGIDNDNTWHHIAHTYDSGSSTNNRNLYLDGVLVASETETGSPMLNFDKFNIGNYDGNSANESHFGGDIAHIALYKYACTSNEIVTIYNAGRGATSADHGITTNIVAEWDMSDIPVRPNHEPIPHDPIYGDAYVDLDTVTDLTGSNDGTVSGTAPIGSDGTSFWREFDDGEDDLIEIKGFTGFENYNPTGGVSFYAWFADIDNNAGNHAIFGGLEDPNSFGTGGDYDTFRALWVNGNNSNNMNFVLNTYDAGSSGLFFEYYPTAGYYQVSGWHFMGFSTDGTVGNTIVYWQGEEVTPQVIGGSATTFNLETMGIGSFLIRNYGAETYQVLNEMDGKIGPIAMYKSQLTTNDFNTIYNAGRGAMSADHGITTGLLSEWDMSGKTDADSLVLSIPGVASPPATSISSASQVIDVKGNTATPSGGVTAGSDFILSAGKGRTSYGGGLFSQAALWYDASQLEYSVGGTVTNWPNLGTAGSDYDLVQDGTNAMPVLSTNYYSGLQSVAFDEDTNFLVLNNLYEGFNEHTIFMVLSMDDTIDRLTSPGSTTIVGQNYPGDENALWFRLGVTTGTLANETVMFYSGNLGLVRGFGWTYGTVPLGGNLYSFRYAGGSSQFFRFNRVTRGMTVTGHTEWNGFVDAYPDTVSKIGVSDLGGSIAEVLFFDSDLNDFEITTVEHYLSKKWGL